MAGLAKPIRALHFALGSPGLAAFVCILHKYIQMLLLELDEGFPLLVRTSL